MYYLRQGHCLPLAATRYLSDILALVAKVAGVFEKEGRRLTLMRTSGFSTHVNSQLLIVSSNTRGV